MNLIIIGGTGLLGHEATLVALEKNIDVTSLAIDDADAASWYPKEAKSLVGDVFTLTEDELYEIFKEGAYDALIYAVGPDDRINPPENAYKFFHKRLVDYPKKVFKAARRAGIKKAVVCSSYFLYFDRRFPKKKLSSRHPYIKVRKEQAEALISVGMDENGTDKMDVVIMELPYIFGTCPNRRPLWRGTFLDHFARGKRVIMFPKGGSVMCSSRHVGEALIGAVLYGKGGTHYPIGDENHDFNWMLDKLLTGVQGKPMRVLNPPRYLSAIGADLIAKRDKRKGLYHGLDYYYVMMDIQSDYFYFPQNEMDDVNEELHIKKGKDVEDAIIRAGKACYDEGEWK